MVGECGPNWPSIWEIELRFYSVQFHFNTNVSDLSSGFESRGGEPDGIDIVKLLLELVCLIY